jgi:predicted O-methyltransferase YrrM
MDMKDAAREAAYEVASHFSALSWDARAGCELLDAYLATLSRPAYNPRRDSVHLLALTAAVALLKPTRILELGTFTGFTTGLLAAVAPAAEIITVDLPDGAPGYEHYVSKVSGGRDAFEAERDKNLASRNIQFLRCDTFMLSPTALGVFDLVWVDAWHSFPNVAWDTYLGYHVCRPGGFLLCDDVEFNKREGNSLSGPDGGHVARYIQSLGLAPRLLIKRMRLAYLENDREFCKYVMVTQKPPCL